MGLKIQMHKSSIWRKNQEKDAKALFLIQQALDHKIFPRIAVTTTSNQAWTQKLEYLGDKNYKLLSCDVETLATKNLEFVQVCLEYL